MLALAVGFILCLFTLLFSSASVLPFICTKKKRVKRRFDPGNRRSKKPQSKRLKESDSSSNSASKPQPPPLEKREIKPPVDVRTMARANDPNYQTLMGTSDNVFEQKIVKVEESSCPLVKDPNEKPSDVMPSSAVVHPKPSAEKCIKSVAENDPNYQTLAALAGEDVFMSKKNKMFEESPIASKPRDAGNNKRIHAPKKGGKAGARDPNYQTLIQVTDDIFVKGKDLQNTKPAAARPVIHKPAKGGKAEARDPNYQTLMACDDDIFDKKMSRK